MYIVVADKLLADIPGPHQKQIESWPKWNQHDSPPVPGGLYLNPKWDAPRLEKAPISPVTDKSFGPTLAEHLGALPIAENLQPSLLEGSESHSLITGTVEDIAPLGLLPSGVTSEHPIVRLPNALAIASKDTTSVISSEDSLFNVADPLAEIRALHAGTKAVGSPVNTSGGVGKHFAIMGGAIHEKLN
jgi:hypothetical protein